MHKKVFLTIAIFTISVLDSFSQNDKIEYVLPESVTVEIKSFINKTVSDSSKAFYVLFKDNTTLNKYEVEVLSYSRPASSSYSQAIEKSNRFIKLSENEFLPIMFEMDSRFVGYGEVNGRTKRIFHIEEHPYKIIFSKKGEILSVGYISSFK